MFLISLPLNQFLVLVLSQDLCLETKTKILTPSLETKILAPGLRSQDQYQDLQKLDSTTLKDDMQ